MLGEGETCHGFCVTCYSRLFIKVGSQATKVFQTIPIQSFSLVDVGVQENCSNVV